MDPVAAAATMAGLAALSFLAAGMHLGRQRERRTEAERRIRPESNGSGNARQELKPSTDEANRALLPRRRVPFLSADRHRRMARTLEQAGLRLTPGEFVALRAGSASLAALIGLMLLGWNVGGWLLALALGGAGFVAPRAIIAWRRRGRLDDFEGQLIDMLALLSSSIRSGFSLLQGLETASRRLDSPLSDDLIRVLSEVRLGRPLRETLEEWAERAGSADLQLVVTAILVQRSSGGNLSEVLENLAQTMRERIELRHEIQGLTAHPRLTAKAVSAYPMLITALLTVMNPDVWLRLWTEPIGWVFLSGALILNAFAFLMLQRIARVEF